MFILNGNNAQSLICAECDEQQMQNKLPRESSKSDIFFERTKCYFFDKVHLDEAFSVLLHVLIINLINQNSTKTGSWFNARMNFLRKVI